MRQNVELHIEELFLRGFDHINRYRVGEAVKCELARSLAEQGLPSSLSRSGDVARLDGGTFDVAPNSRVEAIGSQVAQSVYKGFRK